MIRRLRNRKGFTLIELMIVVAIIGILAAIAIPNFLKFQCKSKVSEARTMLKGVYTAAVSYYGETEAWGNTYAVIGFDANGKYYTFTLSATGTTFKSTASPKSTGPDLGTFNIGYYATSNSDNGMVLTVTEPCTQ